jgi:hypothetical protein
MSGFRSNILSTARRSFFPGLVAAMATATGGQAIATAAEQQPLFFALGTDKLQIVRSDGGPPVGTSLHQPGMIALSSNADLPARTGTHYIDFFRLLADEERQPTVPQFPLDARYSVYLLIAAAWTTLFSMTTQYPLRGLRNFGILACYILLIVMFFKLSFTSAVLTWCAFGIVGGCLYACYELLGRSRANKTGTDSRVPIARLFSHALLAWPVMLPEAIEYLLADLGILRVSNPPKPQASPARRDDADA